MILRPIPKITRGARHCGIPLKIGQSNHLIKKKPNPFPFPKPRFDSRKRQPRPGSFSSSYAASENEFPQSRQTPFYGYRDLFFGTRPFVG